jgi:hypothetical protein
LIQARERKARLKHGGVPKTRSGKKLQANVQRLDAWLKKRRRLLLAQQRKALPLAPPK